MEIVEVYKTNTKVEDKSTSMKKRDTSTKMAFISCKMEVSMIQRAGFLIAMAMIRMAATTKMESTYYPTTQSKASTTTLRETLIPSLILIRNKDLRIILSNRVASKRK